MTKQYVEHLSAKNGKIEIMIGVKGKTRTVGSVKGIVKILTEFGLNKKGYVTHSSSMDFAKEYGFANDYEAWNLWNTATNNFGISKVEDVNSVIGKYN